MVARWLILQCFPYLGQCSVLDAVSIRQCQSKMKHVVQHCRTSNVSTKFLRRDIPISGKRTSRPSVTCRVLLISLLRRPIAIARDTSPLPAPSSTLITNNNVSSCRIRTGYYPGKGTSERTTNIVLPERSCFLYCRRNFVSTIPPGHSWPPHCFSFVCKTKGGCRKPSKFRVTVCDSFWGIEGTRSSDTVKSD